ncbi:MAG: ATP phosphoribosyltransferase regulatory subunit, partial [Sulfurimonas sp.]|nr:ATP phosphoribosyltransferase regulatory subunit [Sulfurimonas sp.]
SYENSVLAPIYYAKMLYYDELFFRVIDKNEVYARGGRYKSSELTSVGFAIYTDALCENLSK